MKGRAVNAIAVFLASFFTALLSAQAAVKRPAVRYSFLYDFDTRADKRDFYYHRVEVFFTRDFNAAFGHTVTLQAVPFYEYRYNVDHRKRERLTAGAEFGLEPVSFFYIGERFQYVNRNERLHSHLFEHDTMTEGVTVLTLSHQLIPKKDIVKGYVSVEQTYDFHAGRSTWTETLAGVLVAIGKSMDAKICWRHRDRIHYYDSDMVEAGLSYTF